MNLCVRRDNGEVKAEAGGGREVMLAWTGEYARGDVITADGLEKNRWYAFKVDDSIEESLVYVTVERFAWPVPFYEKKANRNPLSFLGGRHYLSLRAAEPCEINSFRNLARNPADEHDLKGVYPHASANVETRGESVFAAQNAIDGYKACLCHGEWPYQSWGINRREDAALTIDFGVPVNLDHVCLYLRADLPHDSWWDQATITCSDGSAATLSLQRPDGTGQEFPLQRRGITWIRLDQLIKHPDESPFPALTQLEAYGTVAEEAR